VRIPLADDHSVLRGDAQTLLREAEQVAIALLHPPVPAETLERAIAA
jgi:hypothetical protein